MNSLLLRWTFAIWLVFPTVAVAADINISGGRSGILLEGTITPGDYEKLRGLIKENCSGNSRPISCPSRVFLASNGGSVLEAIKIGRLIRSLRLETEIPDGLTDAQRRQFQFEKPKLRDYKNFL